MAMGDTKSIIISPHLRKGGGVSYAVLVIPSRIGWTFYSLGIHKWGSRKLLG